MSGIMEMMGLGRSLVQSHNRLESLKWAIRFNNFKVIGEPGSDKNGALLWYADTGDFTAMNTELEEIDRPDERVVHLELMEDQANRAISFCVTQGNIDLDHLVSITEDIPYVETGSVTGLFEWVEDMLEVDLSEAREYVQAAKDNL